MNKRLEEKLAMLAFGDMSPEEMTHLEQEVAGNREAMIVLAEYRGMRTGLKAMADVPEHQLSSDRLRHAILTQGLKPKSQPQFGWLWAPVAVAALAFGIVFVRNSGKSVLPGMDPSGGLAIKMPKKLEISDPLASPDSAKNAFAFAVASGQISSVAQQPVLMTASNTTRHHTRSDSSERLDALKQRILAEFMSNEQLALYKPPTVTPSAATASVPKPTAGSPIVLIDSAKDSSTGAQKATEVDSASNVVVGG